MPLFIPTKESKRFSVNLATDLFGNLSRTRNMDFNRPGYIALARKPYVLYTEVEDVDFETPLAILADEDKYYVITSESTFTIDIGNSDMSVSKPVGGTVPSGGFQGDGTFFNGLLTVSDTNGFHSLSGSTWTSRNTALSTSYPHPLCVSEHQNYLAAGDGNTVKLYDTSYTLQATMTIPSDHVVEWIRWRANILWCGTRNIQGGEAKVFLWNGSGTAAQAGYGVGSEWAYSGCNYDYASTVAVVSASGLLLRFNGSGFVPLLNEAGEEMAFPIYNLGVAWGSSAATSNLLGKVASRGMEARGSKIYMNVNSTNDSTSGGTPEHQANFPGGLWVFDPKVGLYHKAGIDHKRRASTAVTSVASDVLTLTTSQVYETGDPVEVVDIGLLTGDIQAMIYYAIKVASNQIKLALTPQQAAAGVAITITGTVTSAELLFNEYESVGAHQTERLGGLAVIKSTSTARFSGSEVVYGGDVLLPATGASIGAVMSLGMGKNVGSFITPRLQASAVTDTFASLVAKFGDLNIATRKILIKYRTKERWGLPGRGNMNGGGVATWVNATSFTVNPKLYDIYSARVGDEIEFLDGGAGGYTAHITVITVNSATQWTITIDESMPDVAASDTSHILIDNFTKLCTISTVDDAKAAYEGLKALATGGDGETSNKAKWFEIKVELRGYTDIEETMDFEELMLSNTADQNYT